MLTIPFQAEPPQDVTDQAAEYAEAAKHLALTHGPRLIAAVAILVIGWFVAKSITGLVRKGMARASVDATLSKFIASLTYMLLMIFVVLAAVSKLGVETASFVAVLGAAGFAVGFALQGSLSNFAAGVMILIFRPFKAGDFIEAGGTMGAVKEIGIFTTVLTTPDNKKVIVPNAAITGGNITNFSAKETRRVDMVFGIGYGDDIKQAKEILERLMAADARVLKDPACTIAVSELGDSSVNFVVPPVGQVGRLLGRLLRRPREGQADLRRRGRHDPLPAARRAPAPGGVERAGLGWVGLGWPSVRCQAQSNRV